MQHSGHIYENLEDLSLEGDAPVFLTIGTFDGVHRAHQSLLNEAVREARAHGGLAATLTFRNHPRAIVNPESCPPLITPWNRKKYLLTSQGIDVVVGLAFTPQFAQTHAENFIQDVIKKRFNTRVLISGPDFHFGRGGKGNAKLLTAMSKTLGFEYRRQEPMVFDGIKISSTRIRQCLLEGDVSTAAQLLGRPHNHTGLVVPGDKLGRTIGFPTANLDPEPGVLLPKDGVYAVRIKRGGRQVYNGMMNIGWRPTVGGKEHRREVHLFDFDGELSGETLEVQYLQRLRDEQKFASLDDLRIQLQQDSKEAIRVLHQDDI